MYGKMRYCFETRKIFHQYWSATEVKRDEFKCNVMHWAWYMICFMLFDKNMFQSDKKHVRYWNVIQK